MTNGLCEQQQGGISHQLVEGLFGDGLESLMLLFWLERTGLMLLLSSLCIVANHLSLAGSKAVS